MSESFDAVENSGLDSEAMTGTEAAEAPPTAARRRRFRLPASRGGVAWLVVLLIIGTFLAAQFGRQVYANWEIGQQARAIEAEIARIEAENAELERELAYLRSDAYIAAEARRLANLGREGEQILIIPAGAEEPLPEELTAVEPPRPLLEQWVELFFGARSSS
jgi:cell division protein FtsB